MRFREFVQIVDETSTIINHQTHNLTFFPDRGQMSNWAVWCICENCDFNSVIEVSYRSRKLINYGYGKQEYFNEDMNIFWDKPVTENIKLLLECLRPTLTCNEIIIKDIIK